jgi:anti-sigma factor RsiW
MKPETLRSLLTDRAMGELSAETAELLDAFLAQNAECAEAATEMSKVVALSRKALAAPSTQSLPVLRLKAPTRAAQKRWSWRHATFPLLAAASLAVGFVLGNRDAPPPQIAGEPPIQAAAASGAMVTQNEPVPAANSIWSEERIANAARADVLSNTTYFDFLQSCRTAHAHPQSIRSLP